MFMYAAKSASGLGKRRSAMEDLHERTHHRDTEDIETVQGDYNAYMSTIRINRTALDEVEKALEQYRELLASLEAEGTLKPSAAKTYILHSENFVRWLKDDFDPGARNKNK